MTAQGVFESVLRREGLEGEVFVDSAGTGSWHVGHPSDERAQRSASSRGMDLSTQRARQVTLDDCHDFEYVLTMDAHGLSPREEEVVGLVMRGLSNRRISQALFISENTVQRHLSNIFEKVGVRGRKGLLKRLFFENLLPGMLDG